LLRKPLAQNRLTGAAAIGVLAVSKRVRPMSRAMSSMASACSRLSPLSRFSGGEPNPPKLPQPNMILLRSLASIILAPQLGS